MVLVQCLGRVRPESRAALLAATAVIAAASRSDDGCLSYGFYTNVEDPEVFLSLETWSDEEALAAHMSHTHTTEFLRLATNLLQAAPVVSQYTIDHPTPGSPAVIPDQTESH